MNDWLNEFSQRDNFTLVRYEALRASPAEHFRDLLAVLGESQAQRYDFPGRTRIFRLRGTCKSWRLLGRLIQKSCTQVDVRDPESFKVRRGKIGGYREYLSAEDQKYAAMN